ncbi:hypothetical protein NST63_01010 [Heyndrickxia sp. FSL W8-0496]|mgnify:CR=1 FL=1|uniref:XkdQ/YqbQ family protein n=1 Tax=Heyndrickxia sp. FSL W8-0496 TaxID=2954702 RepID=UPI0030F4BB19
MGHELWLVKGGTMTNITPIIGSISWKSNIDELGDQIDFDIAYNDSRFHPKNPCDLGDMVILKNGDYEITRSIIVDETKQGRDPITYTSYDFAFYLNKSNAVYQFNKITADQAIKKICKDFNVPIGKIVSMPTKINKIFNDKKVSDIIKEIIGMAEQKQGIKYLMEMRQGKLFIEKQSDLIIKGTFKLAKNLSEVDVTAAISNPSKKRSITDMINSIQIVSNDKLILTKENSSLVNKYGKLQKVVSLDQDEKRSASQIAQNELKQLAKIVEETSIELLGDDRVKSGRLLQLKEPITGIVGTYLIKDVGHTISGGFHKMSLGLEVK